MKLISIKDFELQLAEETAGFLSKCTIQFFRRNFEEGLVAHGSGILFAFQENYFIISASHNFLDEDKENIKIRTGNTIEDIRNSKLIFSVQTGDFIEDKIDTAILKLEDANLIEILKTNNYFIELGDVQLDHRQKITNEEESLESYLYILFGYPGKQSKPKYKSENKWNIKALYLQGQLQRLNSQILEDKGYANHVVFNKLKKGKKHYTGGRVNLPSLKGMSGCGLWDIQGYDLKKGRQKLKLVGIFIEINHNLAISTKIDYAIEMIKHHFGCSRLPSSNHVKNWNKNTAHNNKG